MRGDAVRRPLLTWQNWVWLWSRDQRFRSTPYSDSCFTVRRRSEVTLSGDRYYLAETAAAPEEVTELKSKSPTFLLCSEPAREMTLSGDRYYLAEVAAALGCEPARVWHSGIANRNFRVLAPPGVGREQFAARGGAAGDDAVDEADDVEVFLFTLRVHSTRSCDEWRTCYLCHTCSGSARHDMKPPLLRKQHPSSIPMLDLLNVSWTSCHIRLLILILCAIRQEMLCRRFRYPPPQPKGGAAAAQPPLEPPAGLFLDAETPPLVGVANKLVTAVLVG